MTAISILRPSLVHQPQIGFVDQTSRAQGMLFPFGAELTVRDSAKLLIDQGKEPVKRTRVA